MIDTQIEIDGTIISDGDLTGSVNNNNQLSGEIDTSNNLTGQVSTITQLSSDINIESDLSGSLRTNLKMIGKLSVANSGGGTYNYDYLINKPKINNVELVQNKSFENLGIHEVTNTELNEMFKDL